jgi:DNA-binding NtrC family response regulator
LIATVSRAALSARQATVEAEDILFLHPESGSQQADSRPRAVVPLHEVERDHVQRVLEALSWNKKQAARQLEVSREKLYRMIEKYQLAPKPHARRGAMEGAR